MFRAAILAKWNGFCALCKKPCRKAFAEIDHEPPYSKGGCDLPEKVRVVCGRFSRAQCHTRRHNREPRLRRIPA